MNEVAVITGAAGGVGTSVARLLGGTQRLLLTDVDSEKLSGLVASLTDEGYQVEGISGDLGDPLVAADLADCCAKTGEIRSIVNAAGLSPAQAAWQAIIRANTIGSVNLLNSLEPLLTARSACVMVASVAGHLGPRDETIEELLDNPLQPALFEKLEPRLEAIVEACGGSMAGHAYSFSKRAIIRLCEKRAPSWGKQQARIVSVSPGVIWTPMGRREAESGDRAQALADVTPAGRWGKAMDVATTAEFLLSDTASYITGSDVQVDGGAVAAMRGKAF